MGETMAAVAGGSTSPSQSTTTPKTVTLERSRRGRYRAVGHAALKNNLLAGVGFLELANAGDFAANVWNEIPVPRHAMILMAIGGPIALMMSLVAVRDFYLSSKNVLLLYAERQALLSLPTDGKTAAVLGVNTRELGTESIDRMFMDLLMGFGALLVGIGTIMAIWGADHRVFLASNLLSGFVGNGFAAVFGLVNACWSGYLVYRFQVRYSACQSDPAVQTVRPKLRQRVRRFQWHAGVNGVNGLVAGMASMVTAKMWWGYVVLIPTIIAMIAGNLFWRAKLGYDRPLTINPDLTAEEKEGDEDAVGDALDCLASIEAAQSQLPDLAEMGTLNNMLAFLEERQMFEYFLVWVARQWPDHRFFAASETVDLSRNDLENGSEDEVSRMEQECRQFIRDQARRLLKHRERYLLELVGEAVWNQK
ncbi:hypothetical protein ASPVEDRAFT_35126 [Aspergillus versicolor CBS 583.65]|uniref:Integral membrane protein n=1 Tax=Aspergillus versicolor CBS 583.65 TaxID=1036611 RepID=A0A1L9P2P1_ASPVE|nr:uncharacterized protein ASPVEDRAFT_35126 [Aspergillus versicolor CBS 583.65]OJI95809.1 hypothetical protein ASPVEDRAFT_35126 [Aspergillus versicolor CBS 583.65]